MTNATQQFGQYAAYLRSRSKLALLYRRFWLYPRLARHLRGRVLDVGSGIGDFVVFRPGTVGVDVNPVAVEWCRARGLDVRVMEPDILPFDDGEFDGVILDNVLEHLTDPGPLIREIARVSAKGATLVIGVPGLRGFATDPDHKVFYDEPDLVAFASAAGFAPHKILYAPIRFSWLESRIPQYCLYGVFRRL